MFKFKKYEIEKTSEIKEKLKIVELTKKYEEILLSEKVDEKFYEAYEAVAEYVSMA